jgi:hypothetical protein
VRDLVPTLRDVRALAPDLRRLFRDLDPLIEVSKQGLPALRDTLRGVRPLLAEMPPFLGQLNPILEWLELHQKTVSDFITNGAYGLADTVHSPTGGIGHYLRQIGPLGLETVGIHTKRLPGHRGNAYLPPVALVDPESVQKGIFPNWDCKNAGGEKPITEGPTGSPSCFEAPPLRFGGKQQGRFPHVEGAAYAGR